MKAGGRSVYVPEVLAGTGGEADQPAVQEQRKVKQKHVTHNPVREDE